MKLNHECVRDVLLTLESLPDNEYIDSENHIEYDQIQKYQKSDFVYSVQKLIEANYINAGVLRTLDGDSYAVNSLTWDGHQFLDNIRDNTVWAETKNKVGSAVASASLSIIAEVASSFIKSKFGLN
ncbi:hypothetical protein D3C74_257030 [compost metagenome]